MTIRKVSLFMFLLSGMVSLSGLAEYAPKLYIENKNEKSTIGASVGVKAIVNGVEASGTAFYIVPGETKLIGQLGFDNHEVCMLYVRPSSGGEGILSGIGLKRVYPITETLSGLYADKYNHPNQDILITITNPWSNKGYWAFEFSWRERVDSAPVTVDEAIKATGEVTPVEPSKKKGPTHSPAKTLAFKKPVEIKPVEKTIKGQGASSMAEVVLPSNVQEELNAVIKKRKEGQK